MARTKLVTLLAVESGGRVRIYDANGNKIAAPDSVAGIVDARSVEDLRKTLAWEAAIKKAIEACNSRAYTTAAILEDPWKGKAIGLVHSFNQRKHRPEAKYGTKGTYKLIFVTEVWEGKQGAARRMQTNINNVERRAKNEWKNWAQNKVRNGRERVLYTNAKRDFREARRGTL